MKKVFCYIFLLLIITPCFSQEEEPDTIKTLDDVTARAFEQNRKQSESIIAVKILQFNNADRYNKTSLVNGFNSIAGVRMEERSPGSYRINIRGSSLRSPFGVRNVKIYWNDIPLTDAGGNTYFNQVAWNNFSTIEIFKGPAGSMYGAGTGGLILLNSFDSWQQEAGVEYINGSYHLGNFFTSVRYGQKENRNQLSFAHNQSNGYRIQSKLRRDNFSWISQLKISEKQQLTASVLFTDMYYQTPGALTLTEFNSNPKEARPASGGFLSSINAKAAIFQKNILAGFSNSYSVNEFLNNTTTIYGAFNQIENPSIRNYESRHEPGFGGRSVFKWKKKQGDAIWQITGGAEFQQGYFNTSVSKNRNGNPDTLQTNDEILISAYNFFVQSDLVTNKKWLVAAGLSYNRIRIGIARLNQYPVITQNRTYRNEVSPKISLRKNFKFGISVLTTLAKGFSPPTIAELLPSTGIISTNLEAERGWNYEMTILKSIFRNKIRMEATGFYFLLDDALVQRRDTSGADYFVNAGDLRQKGIEFNTHYTYSPVAKIFIDYFILDASYIFNHFRYGRYLKGTDDFSGKTVPSVPSNTLSVLADVLMKNGLYTSITYYTASKIFLNDANTALANTYHLLGCRLGWKKTFQKKIRLNLYAGADNLLNESYSLGHDINAAGGRYYNAAPLRNYYAGVAFQWIKPVKK